MAQVDRTTRLGRNHANTRRHLAQGLTTRVERHEIPAVLDDQERDQGCLRKECRFGESESTDLHREVHNGRVDDREHAQIDHDADNARQDSRRFRARRLIA